MASSLDKETTLRNLLTRVSHILELQDENIFATMTRRTAQLSLLECEIRRELDREIEAREEQEAYFNGADVTAAGSEIADQEHGHDPTGDMSYEQRAQLGRAA